MKAEFVSASEIRCLKPPPYLMLGQTLPNTSLLVTFNRLSFYTVETSIEYKDTPKVYSLSKFFGSETPTQEVIEVIGNKLLNADIASVEGFVFDLAFSSAGESSGTFYPPKYSNISALTNEPYTYK